MGRSAGARRARARRRRRRARAHAGGHGRRARRRRADATAPSSSRSCARGRSGGRAGISLRLRPSLVARPAQRARGRAAVRRPSARGRSSRGTRRTRCCRSSARGAPASASRSARPRTSTAGRSRAAASQALVDALAARLVVARRRDRDVEPRRRASARRRRPLRRRAARARAHRTSAGLRAVASATAPAAFKLDWALDGPIPWASDALPPTPAPCTSAAPFAEIADSERAPWEGRGPGARPFVLLAQQSLFDPSRAPEGKHTAWAYCHVPRRLGRRRDRRDRGAGRALRARASAS